MLPDSLDLDPFDPGALAALVAQLQAHCTPEELGQFLADLNAWERSIPREARPTIAAYTRMCHRQAFVPVIIRRYLAVMAPLRDSPEWRDVIAWRDRLASLPAGTERRAA